MKLMGVCLFPENANIYRAMSFLKIQTIDHEMVLRILKVIQSLYFIHEHSSIKL